MRMMDNLKRINLEITYRCNLKCHFCYLYNTGNLNKKIPELSLSEIKKFVDTLTHNIEFYITGGEPFIRDDCIEIIKYIKGKGFGCGVNTNGTLLTHKKIEELVVSKLDYIIFSLHGPKKIQNRISGLKDSYKKITDNIGYLLSRRHTKPEVIVTCTVSPLNVLYLDKIYSLCKKLNVDRVIFEHLQFIREKELKDHTFYWKRFFSKKESIITPLYNMPNLIDASMLYKKLSLIVNKINNVPHFEIRPLLSLRSLYNWYNKNMSPRGRCSSPWETMVISPDGNVRVCQLYNRQVENVKKENYRKIWSGKKFNLFRKSLLKAGGLFPACIRCCQRFKIFRYN